MADAALRKALVVDDGELTDVRELLSGLGIAWVEAESFAAPEAPSRVALLVTNARHALDTEGVRPSATTHLVVYREVSRTLRSVLEQSGCDLVLRRPINPSAFRLLTDHALYSGPERRRSRRAVVFAPILARSGERSISGALVQISQRGLGLQLDEEPQLGGELRVTLPASLTGDDPLGVRGTVLSVRPSRGKPSRFDVALAFRLMDVANRRVVNEIMERAGRGAELRPRTQSRTPVQPGGGTDERRAGPRKAYNRRVLAAGAGMSHLLIGRDLSRGGMRVRPDSELELGDDVQLAVHAQPGQPAIMLKAVVARDDDERGLVLRFRDVPDSIARRLEQIVAELPYLPDPAPGSKPPGLVVSEILDRG